MTEGLGFHSQASENFQDFSKAIKKNIEVIEKTTRSSEAVPKALGEIKEFFEKNQQYLSESEARTHIAELLGRCIELEEEVTGGQISQEITDIAKKNINPSNSPEGRTPNAETAVASMPTSTARTKKSVVLPKLTFIEGQKVATTTTKVEKPNICKISVSDMDGVSQGRTYLVTERLEEAAESSVFSAESNDGTKVAVRAIDFYVRPLTQEEKRELRKKGIQPQEQNREEDLKNSAEFEKAMKNTKDGRMNNLCLKSEVLIRYDKINQATHAYEIMPLAKMSVGKLV